MKERRFKTVSRPTKAANPNTNRKISPPAFGREIVPKSDSVSVVQKSVSCPKKGEQDLPEVIPIYKLKDANEEQTEVWRRNATNGPGVLFLYRRKMKLGIGRLDIEETRDFYIGILREIFPAFHISLLDWPSPNRSAGREFPSHPLIKYYSLLAICVSKSEESFDINVFQSALTHAIHEHILSRNKEGWTIVGDETGDFSEFRPGGAGSSPVRSSMIWLAVPPRSNLPRVANLNFHGSGNPRGVNELLGHLNERTECLVFSFPIKQATQQKNAGKIGGSPYLDTWKLTLPLVLHTVNEHSTNSSGVNIYVEQVKELQSGMGVIEPIASLAINGTNLKLAECFVISKNPCEHPWMAYPDAIGHVIKENNDDLDSTLKNQLKNRLIEAPFRQSTLGNQVSDLIAKRKRPLEFLRSLYNLEKVDLRDYVSTFFSTTLVALLEELDEQGWQDLLKHFENRSGDETGQKITSFILEHTDIIRTCQKFKRQGSVFDLCIVALGSANHSNLGQKGASAIRVIEGLFEQGYSFPQNRVRKYEVLKGGYGNNRFDFSHIQPLEGLLNEESAPDEDTIRYLGSQAVARGLRNDPRDVQEALEIESYIRSHTDDLTNFTRRSIYRAELLLQQGHPQTGMDALLEIGVELGRDLIELLESDNYLLATWLKIKFLLDENDHVGMVDFELNHHPSERCAFWYLLAAAKANRLDDDQAKKCISFVESLPHAEGFQANIGAVTVVSIYHRLKENGLELNINIDTHLKNLTENSSQSTLVWLDKYLESGELKTGVLNFTSY